MNPQINPLDALRILDEATATVEGTRQQHILIQQALTSLHTFVVETLNPPTHEAAPENVETLVPKS